MHEFDIIKKYFSKLSSNNKSSLHLNDDVFFDKSKELVISVDTYIEGTHFINFKDPGLVIKKILRSSISDLICKGVKPKYYFISGSGNKKSFNKKNLKKISESLKEEQKKYSIYLSGGDTVYSKKLSFTITTVGFSNRIVLRNKAKINDDIYVTGNLGDSFVGLRILQKKIHLNRDLTKYFTEKYYHPNLYTNITKKLLSIANTSIDISDGLIADLEKLTNRQKNSYKLFLESIPVSKNFSSVISVKNLLKKNLISKGDDYQILFTSNIKNRMIIRKLASKKKVKISLIGKILNKSEKSSIIDRNGLKIKINTKGYLHRFD